MKLVYLIISFLLFSTKAFCVQNNIDSLYTKGDFVKCSKIILDHLEQGEVSKQNKYKYYYYLAEIKRTNEDFNKALIYNKSSKQFISTSKEEIQNLNRRGAIFYQWAHFDKTQGDSAFFFLEKSKALSEKYENNEFYINNLNLIATLWNNHRNNPKKSLELFKSALKKAEHYKDLDLLVQIKTNITLPLLEMGKIDEAIYYLTSIEPILEELNIPIYWLNYYQKLAVLYKRKKDYKKEAYALKKELDFAYDFFKTSKAKQVVEFEEKYKSKLKDLKNKELEKEGHEKTTFIIFILIGFFIVLLILFLYKKLNTQLSSTNNKLSNSVQLNKQIFSILSHDLKQPIVSLQSMMYLMEHNVLTESEKKANELLIQNHLKTTSHFLDDIMTWAKLEIEKNSELNHKTYISPILDHLKNLYAFEINEKNLQIKTNINTELFINKNKMLMFIILKNLIHNAIKFSFTESEISIIAKQVQNKLIFSIENIGSSIPHSTKINLFKIDKPLEQFFKNDSQLGFGLGLSIISKLIYDNNGKIWLEPDTIDNKTVISFQL